MPKDIAELPRYNAISYSHIYFNAAKDKLLTFLEEKYTPMAESGIKNDSEYNDRERIVEETALLDTKLIGDITGSFYIPSYQRGYRWEPEHIRMLLDDIYDNGADNYCLQPVVLKKREDDQYELIDGQQRLTSIFLILKYMKQMLPFVEEKFFLTYETRERSEEFLQSLDESLKDDNVDFYHMFRAYTAIDEWFNDGSADKSLKAINLYKYFGENVKVIWYEVEHNKKEDSIELFTRLNIGKIPLTNAELVKALFLSQDAVGLTNEKQLEIATSWDTIEKELHNNALWSFLTNENPKQYQTRIELIFNMIAKKKLDEKEEFHTFFYFIDRMKKESKVDVWKEIEQIYYILKEWFENRDIYHKVGYLVASGYEIRVLKEESEALTKTKFQKSLDGEIRKTLDLTKEQVFELSYEKSNNKSRIANLLLLFNVETVRLLKDSTEKYSFERHKHRNWSLEHIHAQNSEGLKKKEHWQKWLELHKESLEKLSDNAKLQGEVTTVLQEIDKHYEDINKDSFDKIFNRVTTLLSEEDEDRSYADLLSNMALLCMENNAALSNSTFDVKRNKILKMDRNGEYIPICTRRVFLKYYSNSEDTQLQFWGENDRNAYLDAMVGDSGVLTPYLK